METSPAFETITKVILLVDENNYYEAGTNTGRTLEATCPYATQDMANNILASLSGYQYQPAQATDALMNPAAELGDGITVGGVYTVLASAETTFDELMTADIGAPGQEEIESEYPYISKETSSTERKIAQTRSLITKTAGEIQLSVENLEGEVNSISVTLDGVTISGPSGETLIKGSSIETSTLTVRAANITGTLSANQINLTGAISWGDLDSSLQSDITDVSNAANNAQITANGVDSVVSGWRYGSTTYIDGGMIMADTVMASQLLGGTVQLLNNSQYTVGSLQITGSSSSNVSVELQSDGALRLTASAGYVFMESGDGTDIQIGYNGDISTDGDIRPRRDNYYSCGLSSYRWTQVYAVTGTIQTSDENQKESIETLPDKYIDMLDAITPRRYRYIDGTSGRYHAGFIAQEVKAAMDAVGVSDMEFGGWCLGKDAEGNDLQMLRMEEFMAILLAKIKRLEAQINA